MSTHYVASLRVTKVESESKPTTYNNQTRDTPVRRKSTVANLTVSGKSLSDLTAKVAAHLELVEDGGEIDVA